MSVKIAKDFQRATADRIAEVFREGRQRRVLLADEVGLGKTIIAREVIDRVRDIRKNLNDDMFRVIYVCSNLNIVNQNIESLGINDCLNISESRLSMQHFVMEERMSLLKDSGQYGDGKMPELLIPLTPGTSFSQTNGPGTVTERAMIYVLIKDLDTLSDINPEKLSNALQCNVMDRTWDSSVSEMERRIAKLGVDYKRHISESLLSIPTTEKCFNKLRRYCNGESEGWLWGIIGEIRMLFAQVSLESLEPDLVIMDEFQRFSTLLRGDESEQTMITRKFFGDLDKSDDSPLVLLLSATPYKPYTTLEELNEHNSDAQYEDFMELMEFLFRNSKDEVSFSRVWEDYSRELCHLEKGNVGILVAKKKAAEDKMYQAMCRTERLSDGLISESGAKEIEIDTGDVLSYAQMQRVLIDCKDRAAKQNVRFRSFYAPVDYVKSCPYLLSFMDNYVLKKNISALYSSAADLPMSAWSQVLLLKNDWIYRYKKIPYNNARLGRLAGELFGQKHAERLLWMPASHPYYSTSESNVFEQNKDFSKILVFSAWEMVPRMISCMLSYESERRTILEAFGERGTYTNGIGENRIKDDRWLTEPCHYLADLYDSKKFFGKNIKEIKKDISLQISDKLSGFERTDRPLSADHLYQIMLLLDGKEHAAIVAIPNETIDILADVAIGSPASCLYRILKDDEKVRMVADGFKTLFNRRQSAAVIDLIYQRKSEDVYFEQVLDYCVMGNLQAVLDEWAHMLGDVDLAGKMSHSFSELSNLKIDTTASFGREDEKKWSMRTHIAMAYTNAKTDDKNVQHTNDLRLAFNSPFRPFVLSTTSVGQEGLDFHWYCRKIVHWNIPSNPQDIEQREGRINRYKCLAVRRNIAHLYSDKPTWDDIFISAAEEFKSLGCYNDMVPFWCLPKSFIEERGIRPEMIERIVPMYPMSYDVSAYEHLKAVLSMYRLTMGQPRQEELIDMLGGLLSPKEIQELLFDLSPISREKKS